MQDQNEKKPSSMNTFTMLPYAICWIVSLERNKKVLKGVPKTAIEISCVKIRLKHQLIYPWIVRNG